MHGRDKQGRRLRDLRGGVYERGGVSQAPHPREGSRTKHQRAQAGADVRQGVPNKATVPAEEPELPDGLRRERKGPYGMQVSAKPPRPKPDRPT